MSDIIVVDYDPEWPRIFERLRARLLPALGDVALAIEHVGSTAVPGLAAKPVVDVDVVVRDGDVRAGIERLESLGYVHRGDRGVPQREAFWPPPGSPRHHLYLCPASSAALANHLAIRDHLRRHAADARAYGELKKRLAGTFAHDREGYVEAKTDFLISILRRCGAAEQTLREIESLNRRSPEAE